MPRPGHDPGHSKRRVVDEDPVRALAVLAEALAVVGRHEHDRARGLAPGVERLQQPRELAIDECDLPVVRRLAVSARPDLRRRLVRARADRSSGPRGTTAPSSPAAAGLAVSSQRSTASVVASANRST